MSNNNFYAIADKNNNFLTSPAPSVDYLLLNYPGLIEQPNLDDKYSIVNLKSQDVYDPLCNQFYRLDISYSDENDLFINNLNSSWNESTKFTVGQVVKESFVIDREEKTVTIFGPESSLVPAVNSSLFTPIKDLNLEMDDEYVIGFRYNKSGDDNWFCIKSEYTQDKMYLYLSKNDIIFLNPSMLDNFLATKETYPKTNYMDREFLQVVEEVTKEVDWYIYKEENLYYYTTDSTVNYIDVIKADYSFYLFLKEFNSLVKLLMHFSPVSYQLWYENFEDVFLEHLSDKEALLPLLKLKMDQGNLYQFKFVEPIVDSFFEEAKQSEIVLERGSYWFDVKVNSVLLSSVIKKLKPMVIPLEELARFPFISYDVSNSVLANFVKVISQLNCDLYLNNPQNISFGRTVFIDPHKKLICLESQPHFLKIHLSTYQTLTDIAHYSLRNSVPQRSVELIERTEKGTYRFKDDVKLLKINISPDYFYLVPVRRFFDYSFWSDLVSIEEVPTECRAAKHLITSIYPFRLDEFQYHNSSNRLFEVVDDEFEVYLDNYNVTVDNLLSGFNLKENLIDLYLSENTGPLTVVSSRASDRIFTLKGSVPWKYFFTHQSINHYDLSGTIGGTAVYSTLKNQLYSVDLALEKPMYVTSEAYFIDVDQLDMETEDKKELLLFLDSDSSEEEEKTQLLKSLMEMLNDRSTAA